MKTQNIFIFRTKDLRTCVLAFLIGSPAGFSLAYLLPTLGSQYASFLQARTLSNLGTPAGVPLGVQHMVIIFLNNLVPVFVGFALPFLLSAYAIRFARERGPSRLTRTVAKMVPHVQLKAMSVEVYVSLSLLAVAVSFLQGLFLIGLFPGYVFRTFGVRTLQVAVVYVLPHAPLEFLGVLLATSSGLALRDVLVQRMESRTVEGTRGLVRLWGARRIGLSVLLVVAIMLAAAFLEVFISAPLLRSAILAGNPLHSPSDSLGAVFVFSCYDAVRSRRFHA